MTNVDDERIWHAERRRSRRGRHRANRKPSPDWPMVYFRGIWLRSGHPSRYDNWPVMADYQPAWQQALCARSEMT